MKTPEDLRDELDMIEAEAERLRRRRDVYEQEEARSTALGPSEGGACGVCGGPAAGGCRVVPPSGLSVDMSRNQIQWLCRVCVTECAVIIGAVDP